MPHKGRQCLVIRSGSTTLPAFHQLELHTCDGPYSWAHCTIRPCQPLAQQSRQGSIPKAKDPCMSEHMTHFCSAAPVKHFSTSPYPHTASHTLGRNTALPPNQGPVRCSCPLVSLPVQSPGTPYCLSSYACNRYFSLPHFPALHQELAPSARLSACPLSRVVPSYPSNSWDHLLP